MIPFAHPHTHNDPLNKIDPLGLRAREGAGSISEMQDPGPADPLACAGVTTKPDFLASGADWNHQSSGPNGEQGQLYLFNIPVRYCKGVVRINGFISQDWVQIPGKGTHAKGNDRPFDSNTSARQSRMSVELDFQRGLGRLFVNYTCEVGRFGGEVGCVTADRIAIWDEVDISGATNVSGFNDFSHSIDGDQLTLAWNLVEPSSRVFGSAPCGITSKMTIDFSGDGDSVEVYHYSGSRENVLLQQKEHDLPDLCARR